MKTVKEVVKQVKPKKEPKFVAYRYLGTTSQGGVGQEGYVIRQIESDGSFKFYLAAETRNQVLIGAKYDKAFMRKYFEKLCEIPNPFSVRVAHDRYYKMTNRVTGQVVRGYHPMYAGWYLESLDGERLHRSFFHCLALVYIFYKDLVLE